MAKRLRRTPRVPGQPKASDFWRTPRELFLALHAEFGFQLDLAANAQDRLLQRWLGPGGLADDALAVSWADHGRRGFLNSPYSSTLISAFLAQAAMEARNGFTTAALIPNTPDTGWWQAYVLQAAEIRDIPHRLKFGRPNGLPAVQAMFPSAVAIFRPQPGVLRGDPRRVVWTFRPQAMEVSDAA